MQPVTRKAIVLAGIAFGLLNSLAALAATAADLNHTALERTAARAALPLESLSVARSAKVSLPLQGRTIYSFKVRNAISGEIFDQSMDANGDEVDVAVLLAKEETLRQKWYGRLDERVLDELASARIADFFSVDIWLKTPDAEKLQLPRVDPLIAKDRSVDERIKQALNEAQARQADRVDAAAKPVLDRLASMGYTASFDKAVPVLHATLSAQHIQEVARWSEVLRVYPRVAVKSVGDVRTIVRPTVGVDLVEKRGITGTVRIAQVEVGGLVNTENPNLPRVFPDPNASLCYYGFAPDHAASVAGILRYIAWGADILATGTCVGDPVIIRARSLAAIQWGAQVTNHSWGEARPEGADNLLDCNDRYMDYLVMNYNRLQVIAAGNDGETSGNVSSPGSAYNVLTVGNFDDRDTVAWSNPADQMNPSSGYRDPLSTHGDREKPEVVAPGTNISSALNSSPWWGNVGYGTSYSAPVATGIAALVSQRAPAIVNYPVALKALLLASATHNLSGDRRLSERDGAGGVWAPVADDIARGTSGSWSAFNYDCGQPTQVVGTMSLVAGKRTRVVIVWNTDTNFYAYDKRPSADFDLVILNAAGAVVASSVSYDNTYEIVDFTPGTGGTYRIRVRKDRCELSPRTLAYAWWRNP